MQTRLINFVLRHEHLFKWMVFVRRPVLLKLADFQIYVRLDDWAVGAKIAVKRNYEVHVSSFMGSLLRPGQVVVDVGANIGYYTLLAASRIGDTGKVIAFEPGNDNCLLLKMSLQANHFKNVEIHMYAVIDKEETVGFNIGGGSSNGGIGSIETATHRIEGIALDTFLGTEPRIDIIKMDIEGAEGRALQGMKQLIQRHRPIIFTEFSPHGLESRSNLSAEAYLEQLFDLGYDLFVLDRKTGKSRESQSIEQIMGCFAGEASDHLDLVAYPKTKVV